MSGIIRMSGVGIEGSTAEVGEMARTLSRLSAADLKRNKVGLIADEGGLYLQVTEAKGGGHNRSWLFRYKVAGRDRFMGGGSTHTVTLALAREWARQQRLLRFAGVDPIAARDAERAARAQESARSLTFQQCAEQFLKEHEGKWTNAKHAAEWP